MAYGKLAEGDRIWDSATDGDVASADFNELHDQLKAMLGPRQYNLTADGGPGAVPGSAAYFRWQYATGDWISDAGSAANAGIKFPITLYAGQVITDIRVRISGAVGALNGTAVLAYGASEAALTTTALVGATGNFWDTGGSAVGNAISLTLSAAPLPLTVADDSQYFLYLVGPSNVTTSEIWDVQITAQFGN